MVTADLVIRDAVVWGRPDATALAVRAGRIIWVGSDDEAAQMTGPRTSIVHAHGGSVLPGFQDAHVHPPMGGLEMVGCQLQAARNPEDVARLVHAHVGTLEDGAWLIGAGWEFSAVGGQLDREFLDALTPGRPAYLVHAGRHDAWVNTQALEVAGISDATPDPPDGRWGRRPDGTLNGVLHEGATIWMEALTPQPTQRDREHALLAAQAHLHGFGITAWQDAWTTPEMLDAYVALAGRGELTARVVAAMWWERGHGLEQVESFVERRRSAAVGRLRAGSVKIMVDGTTGNFSAAVLEPYVGHPGCGTLFLEPDELRDAVTALDALGFQAHFHAIGERAVREALNAVEHAQRRNGRWRNRHHIAHVCLVHPDDIPRFADLGVTANIQPLWAESNPDMVSESAYLGEERSRWWYPFESLRSSGARLAGGSDWPVSSADPMLGLFVGVHRVAPGSGAGQEVFIASERLDLADAVNAYTSGSAFVNGLDADTGEIRVGAYADLAVMDRDLLTADHDPTTLGRAVMTWVEGEVVFVDETADLHQPRP
jgi:predicted amidohydrolase YtcJ